MTKLETLQQQARKKAAITLTPLIKQIFHGDNSTSEKIHEELDNALDNIVSLIASAYHAGEKEAIKELEAISEELGEDAWSRIKYQYDARNAE